jgi:hypothetical protein
MLTAGGSGRFVTRGGRAIRVIWIQEAQSHGAEFLSHCFLTLFTCQSIEGPNDKCVQNSCSQALTIFDCCDKSSARINTGVYGRI